MSIAKAVLDRARKVANLEDSLLAKTAAMVQAKGSATPGMATEMAELRELAPFANEPNDGLQVLMLKSRGRDLEVKQISLAVLMEREGDHGGQREMKLAEYENQISHLDAILEGLGA
jgi:hypothetical protein